jgi:hypothetical protein
MLPFPQRPKRLDGLCSILVVPDLLIMVAISYALPVFQALSTRVIAVSSLTNRDT